MKENSLSVKCSRVTLSVAVRAPRRGWGATAPRPDLAHRLFS